MHNRAGPSISSDGLDKRRKKLLFRSWHRGIKEMDIVLGTYADAKLAGLTNDELDEYERLLDIPDRELFKWISGEAPTPENHKSPLLDTIIAFHTH